MAEQNADNKLRKELWVIMTDPEAPREEFMKHREAHLAHQVDLEKRGIMFGAGPLAEPDGTRTGGGMIIIRADSEEEARKIADADPMHSSGVRSYRLFKWTLAEGTFSVTLNFSDRTYTFD